MFDRLAGAWTYWGWKGGYFATEADARAFFDEMRYMLAAQMAAPNSPQWFNTGLHWAYGIDGPAAGHYYVDFETGEQVRASASAYERPQPHACFIQSVEDDLVNEGGIMDLWVREARLFKYGSGHRHQLLEPARRERAASGGGKSSGLMSFLKIGDRAAGAIKSGGTTRRAAKMVIVDIDHPDIEDFINWKVRRGAEGGGAGRRLALAQAARRRDHGRVPRSGAWPAPTASTRKRATRRSQGGARARKALLPEGYDPAGDPLRQPGLHRIEVPDLRHRLGQRRLPHRLGPELEQLGAGRPTRSCGRCWRTRDWQLIRRTDGKVAKTLKAASSGTKIGDAAWACADPGVQYDTTINDWHTCPRTGRINASNPVLGVHVPRRHGLQPGVAEPDELPARGRHASTSTTSSTRSGSGRSCSRSRC